MESTDELIVGNKYVVWGNLLFGDKEMYGWYDYSPGDSDGIHHNFKIDKDSCIAYSFPHWDRTDGNLPRTPQNIAMPECSPPANQWHNYVPKKNEIICRGSMKLGTGCGSCGKCRHEKLFFDTLTVDQKSDELGFEPLSTPPPTPPYKAAKDEQSIVIKKSMELYISYISAIARNTGNARDTRYYCKAASEVCDEFEKRFGETDEEDI